MAPGTSKMTLAVAENASGVQATGGARAEDEELIAGTTSSSMSFILAGCLFAPRSNIRAARWLHYAPPATLGCARKCINAFQRRHNLRRFPLSCSKRMHMHTRQKRVFTCVCVCVLFGT